MTDASNSLPKTNSSPWTSRPFHRQYLMRQANNLFDFFEAPSLNPKGGFFELDDDGQPLSAANATRRCMARRAWCTALPLAA